MIVKVNFPGLRGNTKPPLKKTKCGTKVIFGPWENMKVKCTGDRGRWYCYLIFLFQCVQLNWVFFLKIIGLFQKDIHSRNLLKYVCEVYSLRMQSALKTKTENLEKHTEPMVPGLWDFVH